jgi:high affinity sulfate transporter 1
VSPVGDAPPRAPDAGGHAGHRLLLPWLRGQQPGWARADLLAGLTTAAVVVPKAMAYATVAGLPPQVGLYTAFVPAAVYALVGGSRVLSVTTTGTLAILAAAALGEVASGASAGALLTATATLSLLVGLLLVAAGLLRLGFVANFISEPVLAGFKAAIGLVIVVDQLPKALGLHLDKAGFLRDLAALAGKLGETSLPTLAVSVATAALILGMKRWLPALPAALIAVALGIGATFLLGLGDLGVKTIGALSGGLPSPVRPDPGLLAALWPAAVGIALMSFTETIAAGRAFAGADPRPAANRELVATGLANAAGGLFGAMPAGGGTSQTSVARRSGARSQLAGLVGALAALAVLLFLAPAIALLPQATLATIVIIYSAELVSLGEFRAIRAVRRMELLWSAVAFAGVVVLGTLKGILVAVITSIVGLAHQANNPPVYALGRKPGTDVYRRRTGEHAEDETFPGLLLLRVEGRLYFGNAERVIDLLAALVREASPRVVVLECSAIFDIEYSALKMLAEAEQRVRQHGGELWLAALNPEVLRVVQRSPLGQALGRERLFFTTQHAVERYRAVARA